MKRLCNYLGCSEKGKIVESEKEHCLQCGGRLNVLDKSTVNNPKHYNQHPSGVECITITKHFNFNIGNAIKYLWRAGLKEGSSVEEDLSKASWYIARELERRIGK